MAIPRRIFIGFIQDEITNLCYYRDANGNLKTTSIFSAGIGGVDCSLKSAPGNWMDIELGFIRNEQYFGFNRGATTPLDLVRDAAFIVRTLVYTGQGVEANLRYVLLKYNDQPDSAENYTLYYRGRIDLPKLNDLLAEKLTVNLIDGGAPALFKAYEETPFKIPCNGSIPQNKRILYDGLLVQNNALYDIATTPSVPDGWHFIPFSFINNDGDSFGVISGSQYFGPSPVASNNSAFATLTNYIFSCVTSTTLTINGDFIIGGAYLGSPYFREAVNLYLVTPLKTIVLAGGSTSLNDVSFKIRTTVKLEANENVFIVMASLRESIFSPGINIRNSSFTLSYASAYVPTAVWGLTLYDLFQLLVQYMNQYAVIDSGVTYDIGAASLLLQKYLNIFATCGDALRASGNQNYQKFYDPISTQSGSAINLNYTYGPTIKTTIKDCFSAVSAVLCAALGTQLLSGNSILFETTGDIQTVGSAFFLKGTTGGETIVAGAFLNAFGNQYQIVSAEYSNNQWVLQVAGATLPGIGYYNAQVYSVEEIASGKEEIFIEAMEYVFDSSSIDFDCGEVAQLAVQFAAGQSASAVKIGYAPQTYDQLAGKYEYNTTAEWKSPILSFKKEMQILCPYRTDSYGKEKLRSNIGAATSTTRNDSDNDVFLESVDLDSATPDYFEGSFESQIPNPNTVGNTNLLFPANIPFAGIALPVQYGDYFQQKIDFAIIAFTNPDAGAQDIRLQVSGNVSSVNKIPGSAPDSVTLSLCKFGVPIAGLTFTIEVNNVETVIAIDQAFSNDFSFEGVVWLAATTTQTAVVQIDSVTLTVGTAGSIVILNGSNIQIQPGLVNQLISMPTSSVSSSPYVPGTSVMQYGYQYYQFNTVMPNSQFRGTLKGSCWIYTGDLDYVGIIDVMLNGVSIQSQIITATARNTWQQFAISMDLGTLDFKLGDVLYLRLTTGVTAQVSISSCQFTLTSLSVVAYNLLREDYQLLSGVPNLAMDANGDIKTNLPGAPYSITPFTPKRMLQAWKRYLMGGLYNQAAQSFSFQVLSKNEFLATQVAGQNPIIEDADEPITDPRGPLFYPWILTFTTQVQKNFSEIMSNAANGHVKLTFCGREFFGFPMEIKQKPALNEAQTWKLLLSPKTNLANLANVTIDGLTTFNMGPNSLAYSYLLGFQFFPKGETLSSRYHTKSRNLFPYTEQIKHWINTTPYKQPVQIGDPLPFQLITRGLDPIQWALFDSTGAQVASATLTKLSSVNGLASEYSLYQEILDSSTIIAGEPPAEGYYYWELTAGSGETAVVIGSEVIEFLNDQSDTIVLEYTHSANTQGMYFVGTGFSGFMRVKARFDNRVKPKYKGAFFIDEPQDITVLNAVPFETMPLWVGLEDGVPDWVMQKISRILLLDGAMIEGEPFSVDENAEWDETFIDGSPKKYWTIDIRPAKNQFGTTLNAAGADPTATMIITTQAKYFGPNADNSSDSTDTDFIELEVNN